MKRPLILFSGGLESTLCLDLTLSQPEGCDILTLEHAYNLPSAKAEAEARAKILAMFEKRKTPGRVWDHAKVTGTFQLFEHNHKNGYGQLYGHLHYLFDHVDANLHSSVQLGLCMSDDTATIHNDLFKLWDLMQDVYRPGQEHVPLVLPLLYWSKAQVQARLGEIAELTWSCGFPLLKRKKWVQCGQCISCTDNRHAEESSVAASYVQGRVAYLQG